MPLNEPTTNTPVANVSAYQIKQAGQETGSLSDSAQEIMDDFQYDIDALGDFAGNDEPGKAYTEGLLNPVMDLTRQAIYAFRDSMSATNTSLDATAGKWTNTNVNNAENVPGIHIGRS
jgi:hypothetical protein